MLLKLYGLLDLASGIVLLLLRFNISKIADFILAFYLVAKSLYYIKSLASIVDILAAVFIVLAALGIYNILSYLFAIWLLQKGISSIFFS